MFVEALESLLRDFCSPGDVRRIESGGADSSLTNAIQAAGFLELFAPEGQGGAGLSSGEQCQVLMLLGRYAVPLPIAQGITARLLVSEVPEGHVTLAPFIRKTTEGWVCPRVPFGSIAEYVLADDGNSLLLFRCEAENRFPAGVPRSQLASLTFDTTHEPLRFPRQGDAHQAYSTALLAASIAGAMDAALELTLQYANDRTQFGRPIAKFQVIQHGLAVMAQEVVAARVATEAAFHGSAAAPTLLAAAYAKARTSAAVTQVANTAHAVHGAIGVTQEHNLQLFTRRMHEWRIAGGSEVYWHEFIGRAVIASGQPTVEFLRNVVARDNAIT